MVRRAAVAVVLRDVGELQVLLVKRKERLGDPWSGQIALPGGMQKDLNAFSRPQLGKRGKKQGFRYLSMRFSERWSQLTLRTLQGLR